MLTSFLDFSSKNRLSCSFSSKINCNLVIQDVIIHLIYIRILCTTLKECYLIFIQGIINIFKCIEIIFTICSNI